MSVSTWARHGDLAFTPVGSYRCFPAWSLIEFLVRELAATKRAKWLTRLSNQTEVAQ
jgi:hypothetical protein